MSVAEAGTKMSLIWPLISSRLSPTDRPRFRRANQERGKENRIRAGRNEGERARSIARGSRAFKHTWLGHNPKEDEREGSLSAIFIVEGK